MSIRVMSRVWEHSQHGGTELLLLLAVSDFANDDGIAWPSVARLAQKVRMSERGTQYIIQRTIDSGELLVKQGTGRRNTSTYAVLTGLDAKNRSALVRKLTKGARPAPFIKGANDDKKGAIAIAPDPSLRATIIKSNHQEEGAGAPATKKPVAELMDHSAVIAYRNECLNTPNIEARRKIAAVVTDCNRWVETIKNFKVNRWNTHNIVNLLDAYQHGTNNNSRRNNDRITEEHAEFAAKLVNG